MRTYQLRAQHVEAIQWTGQNAGEVLKYFGNEAQVSNGKLTVITLDGNVEVKVGWYISRDLEKGNISVSSTNKFESLLVL